MSLIPEKLFHNPFSGRTCAVRFSQIFRRKTASKRIQIIAATAALALAAGCSTMNSVGSSMSSGMNSFGADVSQVTAPVVHLQQRIPPTEQMSDAPIPTDGAMALRVWDPTPAFYVNDAVWAWPNYSPLQPGVLPYELNIFTEPFLFLGNLIYIAPGVFIEIPWNFEVYKSLSPPPSYTAMPPLPNGPEQLPRYVN
jgi:hypothetical protein